MHHILKERVTCLCQKITIFGVSTLKLVRNKYWISFSKYNAWIVLSNKSENDKWKGDGNIVVDCKPKLTLKTDCLKWMLFLTPKTNTSTHSALCVELSTGLIRCCCIHAPGSFITISVSIPELWFTDPKASSAAAM